MESIKQIGSKVVASFTAVALCGTLSFGFVANQPAQAYADDLAATSLSTQANGPAADAVNDEYGQIVLSHWDAAESSDDYRSFTQQDETGAPQTVIYNSYNMTVGLSVNGISYNKAKNMITLKDVDDSTGILHIKNMGENLKIVVDGENNLAKINVEGGIQGASLEITGDGTLNLNKSKYDLGSALYLYGGQYYAKTKITEAEYDAGTRALENAIIRHYFTSVEYDYDWVEIYNPATDEEDEVKEFYKKTYSLYPAKIVVDDTVNLNAYAGNIWSGNENPVCVTGTTLSKSKALQFKGVLPSKAAYSFKGYGQKKIIGPSSFTAAWLAKMNKQYSYIQYTEPYDDAVWYDVTTHYDYYYDADKAQWYRWGLNKADVSYNSYYFADPVFTQFAKEATIGKLVYSVKSVKDKTVTVKKVVKGKKTVTIPKKVKINGKKFAVTGIDKKAFKTSKKTKTLKIETKKLTKKSVKKSLKGSKITTVKVPKKCLDDYTKYFAKKNSGKKVTVK